MKVFDLDACFEVQMKTCSGFEKVFEGGIGGNQNDKNKSGGAPPSPEGGVSFPEGRGQVLHATTPTQYFATARMNPHPCIHIFGAPCCAALHPLEIELEAFSSSRAVGRDPLRAGSKKVATEARGE